MLSLLVLLLPLPLLFLPFHPMLSLLVPLLHLPLLLPPFLPMLSLLVPMLPLPLLPMSSLLAPLLPQPLLSGEEFTEDRKARILTVICAIFSHCNQCELCSNYQKIYK